MRALIAAAMLAPLASSATTACSWDRPGHNPFMGDVVAAVDRYTDIQPSTRTKLKARMQRRLYDEIVTIRRDSIEGAATYSPSITGMHFGQGQVCGTVTRARWTPQMRERGLVYCEDDECILVPTVCRNVSRIKRIRPAPTPQPAGDEPIDISPSAGGWGTPGQLAPIGPGLRLPPWAPPAELPMVTPHAGPPLASTQAETEAASSAMPMVWMDRLPALTPEPAPLLLQAPTPPVPEPAAWTLMAIGLAGLLLVAKSRSKASRDTR